MIDKTSTLFVCNTHGDESIGFDVLAYLSDELSRKKIDWLIANPLARQCNRRFIDDDLNRSFPGNERSTSYEFRRAAELIPIIQRYRSVIDLHGTVANTGLFTIITRDTAENRTLARSLPLSRIVIWTSAENKPAGPLVSCARCGVEIEAGPMSDQRVVDRLKQVVKKIIYGKVSVRSKLFFRVYGKIGQGEVEAAEAKDWRDFRLTNWNGESFYPLLVGQYDSVVCYKMTLVQE